METCPTAHGLGRQAEWFAITVLAGIKFKIVGKNMPKNDHMTAAYLPSTWAG